MVNALDVLVDCAFIVGCNLDYRLDDDIGISKANFECIPILKEKASPFEDEVIVDDGFRDILNKIANNSNGPVIMGLLNSIFRTSYRGPSTPISSLIWKEKESKRVYENSLYYTPKAEILKLINGVIKDAENFMRSEEKLKIPEAVKIDLPELIASRMAAAAAGGSK